MSIVIPIVLIVVIGLVAGIGLTLASRYMAISVDVTIANINSILPGVNCGACGFAGCADYAYAIANDEKVEKNLCPVGGRELVNEIGVILGLEIEAAERKTAIVKCGGTYSKTKYIMFFSGLQSCKANTTFYKGRTACEIGCLGYGDCVEQCDYGAITIYRGAAKVDKNRCVGCELCIKACPHHLIEMVTESSKTHVLCKNTDPGAVTRTLCSAGCLNCGKCADVCKFDAVIIENNLARIDYAKCKNCGLCVKVCPVKIIALER